MPNGGPAQVVRSYFASFAYGGIDAAAEFWHPQIEWHVMKGAAGEASVVRGRDAMRRYADEWMDMFEGLSADVPEVVLEDGGRASWRRSGTRVVAG